MSECSSRLTIEAPTKHLSAYCVSLAPLAALPQLALLCSPTSSTRIPGAEACTVQAGAKQSALSPAARLPCKTI